MVILFDQYHLPENVFDIVFSTDQQALVAKMLVEHMKKNKNIMGKTEMSMFANQLHEGIIIELTKGTGAFKKTEKTKISYNKRQFYDRILTPMRSMGMIDYDMYKKNYILDDKFQKTLIKIGLMWKKEISNEG
ncbi:MAG: hypothetical protein QXG86_01215 [Candidatus Woesearchaeota archaeon]